MKTGLLKANKKRGTVMNPAFILYCSYFFKQW